MSKITQFIDILKSSKTISNQYSKFLDNFSNRINDLKCGKISEKDFFNNINKEIDNIISNTDDKNIISLFSYIKVLSLKIPATINEEWN